MTTGFVTTEKEHDHTLVVVFLRGGADGLTMVPPVEDDGYHRARPQLRVSKGDALPLDGMFGLHASLGELHPLFKDGRLAVIHAVGSEDTTRSHFEAQDFMEQGGPAGGGWLGRYLRTRTGSGANPLAAVAMGTSAPESLRGAPASVVLDSFDTFDFGDSSSAYLAQLARLYGDRTDALGNAGCKAVEAVNRIQQLNRTAYRPAAGAAYGDDDSGQGLLRIARLVKAGVGIEAATIDLDGWDSHIAQGPLLDPLLQRLSRNLAAFAHDLGARLDHVTVVVMSEFGRRVFENASFGTDHGRGGVMFVMGGGVKGGEVYSAWPGLEDAALDGPGDVPVTTNYRNVLAAVLEQAGTTDFSSVFPSFPVEPLPLYA